MGILGWIVVGLIAGFIGSKLMDRRGQGFWVDVGLGIAGVIVAGFLFSFFCNEGVTSLFLAVAGSVVVLLLYNLLMGQRWT
jgi:uncharacterized membrane protein YeaQ/YmgE (transglycosylase-associated protein family)